MPNTITVRLFARLADLAGTRQLELEAGEGLTAGEAYRLLVRRHPELAGFEASLMYARNQEYVDAEEPLQPGDELALIPPVSGGGGLFEVTPLPLDAEKVTAHVRVDEAGAIALFHGIVRNENLGRRVLYLEYDAYPEMAEKVLRQIAGEVCERWPVTEIAVQHRTGRLEIGETSLLVGVSSPHRGEAFEACHWFVDELKARVPVWKKEVFEGGEEWIEGPQRHE